MLPGLINAHDHLELNHYGRLKVRDRYENASEWIDDLRPRLDRRSGDSRRTRRIRWPSGCSSAGSKNLLAGVTTVAHHNPRYPEMRRTMPVRVVRRYGWAHSFLLERQPVGARGEPGGDVARAMAGDAADAPFMLHLAEGVDEEARARAAAARGARVPAAEHRDRARRRDDGDGWRRVARRRRQPGVVPGVERVSVRPQRSGARPARRDDRRMARRSSTSRSAPIPASPARAICSTSCASPAPRRRSRRPSCCAW